MRHVALVVLLCLSGCADSCDCGGDAHGSAPSTPPSTPPEPPSGAGEQPNQTQLAAAMGSPVLDWKAFSPFAPDEFQGYKATTPADGKVIELPSGLRLTQFHRLYTKDAISFELEMLDTSQSPGARQMFARAAESAHESATGLVRPAVVQGYKALEQWNQANETARVGILIADRFIVNVNVKPAANAAEALKLAQSLSLAALEKLAPPGSAAPTPATPATPATPVTHP